jgi:cysteinyl-tRNA synthetase
MDVFVNFRDKIKANAGQDKKVLFDLCDNVRDDILPFLGIQLEDKGKDPTLWKYEDKEILLKRKEERDTKKAKAAEEKRKKEEAADMKKRQALTPGKDWFSTWETDKYSKFNVETGLPTHAIVKDPKTGDISDKALND